jgi:hypothetical protein
MLPAPVAAELRLRCKCFWLSSMSIQKILHCLIAEIVMQPNQEVDWVFFFVASRIATIKHLLRRSVHRSSRC